VKNLLLVVAFAFIFTFCIGILLKNDSKATIAAFARWDRLDTMRPITLAQKCLSKAMEIANLIFSNFSKNWEATFT